MQEIIENIMSTVDKKKVQSLCKKILKKCSFRSRNDLSNVSDLATWLYIYGCYEEALAVCNLLSGIEFSGNYKIWKKYYVYWVIYDGWLMLYEKMSDLVTGLYSYKYYKYMAGLSDLYSRCKKIEI